MRDFMNSNSPLAGVNDRLNAGEFKCSRPELEMKSGTQPGCETFYL